MKKNQRVMLFVVLWKTQLYANCSLFLILELDNWKRNWVRQTAREAVSFVPKFVLISRYRCFGTTLIVHHVMKPNHNVSNKTLSLTFSLNEYHCGVEDQWTLLASVFFIRLPNTPSNLLLFIRWLQFHVL